MKKIITITAAVLTLGFIGASAASAHFGPYYGNGHRVMHAGPGLMHRAAHVIERGYGRGPGYCLPANGKHWRGERHQRRGHAPRHRGYRW